MQNADAEEGELTSASEKRLLLYWDLQKEI